MDGGIRMKKTVRLLAVIFIVILAFIIGSNMPKDINSMSYALFDRHSFEVIENKNYAGVAINENVSEQYRLCWEKETSFDGHGSGKVSAYQDKDNSNLWLLIMESTVMSNKEERLPRISEYQWNLTWNDDSLILLGWSPNRAVTANENVDTVELQSYNLRNVAGEGIRLHNRGDSLVSFAEGGTYNEKLTFNGNIPEDGYTISAILEFELKEQEGEFDWNWMMQTVESPKG